MSLQAVFNTVKQIYTESQSPPVVNYDCYLTKISCYCGKSKVSLRMTIFDVLEIILSSFFIAGDILCS